MPGSVESRTSRGCHRLIRDGAKLVETADDVLEELGPLVEAAPRRRRGGASSGGTVAQRSRTADSFGDPRGSHAVGRDHCRHRPARSAGAGHDQRIGNAAAGAKVERNDGDEVVIDAEAYYMPKEPTRGKAGGPYFELAQKCPLLHTNSREENPHSCGVKVLAPRRSPGR